MTSATNVTVLAATCAEEFTAFERARRDRINMNQPFERLLAAFRQLPKVECMTPAEVALKMQVVADLLEPETENVGGYNFTREGMAILRSAAADLKRIAAQPTA